MLHNIQFHLRVVGGSSLLSNFPGASLGRVLVTRNFSKHSRRRTSTRWSSSSSRNFCLLHHPVNFGLRQLPFSSVTVILSDLSWTNTFKYFPDCLAPTGVDFLTPTRLRLRSIVLFGITALLSTSFVELFLQLSRVLLQCRALSLGTSSGCALNPSAPSEHGLSSLLRWAKLFSLSLEPIRSRSCFACLASFSRTSPRASRQRHSKDLSPPLYAPPQHRSVFQSTTPLRRSGYTLTSLPGPSSRSRRSSRSCILPRSRSAA